MAAKKKTDIRSLLASKKPRTTSATFPIGDEGEAAQKAVEEARQALELQRVLAAQQAAKGGRKIDTTAAESKLTKAEQEFSDASMTLVFRGLTPVELDALADEFTVPEPAEGEEPAPFNVRGYTCALLAACVVDSDLTPGEWDEELYASGRWSDGEIDHIRNQARAAYQETSSPGIPKG